MSLLFFFISEPSTLVKIVSQCFNALMASDSWISTDEEFNQEPTAKPDGIAMLRNAHINKKEKYASALEESVIMDTEGKRVSSEYQRIQSPLPMKGGSKIEYPKVGRRVVMFKCLSAIPIPKLKMTEI